MWVTVCAVSPGFVTRRAAAVLVPGAVEANVSVEGSTRTAPPERMSLPGATHATLPGGTVKCTGTIVAVVAGGVELEAG